MRETRRIPLPISDRPIIPDSMVLMPLAIGGKGVMPAHLYSQQTKRRFYTFDLVITSPEMEIREILPG